MFARSRGAGDDRASRRRRRCGPPERASSGVWPMRRASRSVAKRYGPGLARVLSAGHTVAATVEIAAEAGIQVLRPRDRRRAPGAERSFDESADLEGHRAASGRGRERRSEVCAGSRAHASRAARDAGRARSSATAPYEFPAFYGAASGLVWRTRERALGAARNRQGSSSREVRAWLLCVPVPANPHSNRRGRGPSA